MVIKVETVAGVKTPEGACGRLVPQVCSVTENSVISTLMIRESFCMHVTLPGKKKKSLETKTKNVKVGWVLENSSQAACLDPFMKPGPNSISMTSWSSV